MIGFAVDENVVWFYVSMADAYFVEIEETPEHLVGIDLDKVVRHHLFSIVVFDDAVDCVGEVVHDDIEELLVGLLSKEGLFHFEDVDVV